MIVILMSKDVFLSEKLGKMARDAGHVVLRSSKVERVIKELKQPDRAVLVDITLAAVQERGVLRQLVNIGRISGNYIVCICPNQDEKLKKLAKNSRVHEVFLRYDLETLVKDFLIEIFVKPG